MILIWILILFPIPTLILILTQTQTLTHSCILTRWVGEFSFYTYIYLTPAGGR